MIYKVQISMNYFLLKLKSHFQVMIKKC